MNNYQRQVEAAIQATVFHSRTKYSWFGKQIQQLPPAIKRVLTPNTARTYLLFNLQSQLYIDFYCRGFALPARQSADSLYVPANTMFFVKELSAANSGNGYWEDGWDVRAFTDDELVVYKEGLEVRVRPQDCLVPRGGLIALGTRLSLRFPKEFLSISPGFYMALSNKEFTQDDSQSLVRIYWNLIPESVVGFMRNATSVLNQAQLAFKLKVLNDPNQFTRCDAAVLYIRKNDYDAVSEILGGIYPEVGFSLRQGIPTFTKPLAAGVGLAEDPAQGESFGMHRCGLLADGMIRAHEQGKKSVRERLRVVEDRFAEDGIGLDKPFLNSGSRDDYNLEPQLPHQILPSRIPKTVPHTDPNTGAFLRTADEIGLRLSQEAVWHQDRCNWLGAKPGMHSSTNSLTGMAYSALGPELYSGTSGVALFLAELYVATGGTEARRTALGAIRQALSRVDTVPPPSRLGLYTGWVGIVFAAARVATILGEEEIFEHAALILQRSVCEHHDGREFDLISGSAGAIAALVVLQDMVDDTSLLDFAVQLGDELVLTAQKSDAGYSWKTAAFPNQRNLTGFSHGTAGVGYALLELFHATGDSKYQEAAELAFQYERSWFDIEAGNWPDFRKEPGQSYRSKRPLSFATAWCHGAPGIALSRLRAYEIINDETCKAEASTALQTTFKMIETSIHSGTGNYSLCHGLAGNAEALLYGSQVLGQEWADNSVLAQEVGNIGIETHAKREHQWPCGTGGGETPNLMLGLAGIGYFYLRLHNLAIPSILILRRESFLHKPKK
jgi:hypothetical protein